MALPALGILSDGARVSVMSNEYVARVFSGMDGVEELMVVAGGGRAAMLKQRRAFLRGSRPDATVILPPSFSSALAPWLARVPNRVGQSSDGRAGLLDVAAPRDTRKTHLSRTYTGLVEKTLDRLGVARAVEPPSAPRPRVFERDREAARAAMSVAGVPDGFYAVLVPGAAFGPAKSWPAERFRELAGRLSADLPVVLSGGPREKGLCARIADGLSGVHSIAGRTDLGGFLALLDGASAVVANDSGSPHAAASLGTPVVVLFGSTSPEWTAPLGEHVDVVREPVHCSPCFRRECPTQLECFQGITVDRVLARTRAALAGTGPAAGKKMSPSPPPAG